MIVFTGCFRTPNEADIFNKINMETPRVIGKMPDGRILRMIMLDNIVDGIHYYDRVYYLSNCDTNTVTMNNKDSAITLDCDEIHFSKDGKEYKLPIKH